MTDLALADVFERAAERVLPLPNGTRRWMRWRSAQGEDYTRDTTPVSAAGALCWATQHMSAWMRDEAWAAGDWDDSVVADEYEVARVFREIAAELRGEA